MRWPGALAPGGGGEPTARELGLNFDRVTGSSAQVFESTLLLRSDGATSRRRRNQRRMNRREDGMLVVENRHRARWRNRSHYTNKRPAEAQSYQTQSKLDCLSLITLRHLNKKQLKFEINYIEE
jgi:hypothetical protein